MMHVALHAPRIPQNVGQVARTCFAAGCALHLIRPLGFRIDDASLKRSAVGYLDRLDWRVHPDMDAFAAGLPEPRRLWLITRHGRVDLHAADFAPGDALVLGNETEGLPREMLEQAPERTVRITMPNPEARCLNLASAAAIVIFEALRQNPTGGGRPTP